MVKNTRSVTAIRKAFYLTNGTLEKLNIRKATIISSLDTWYLLKILDMIIITRVRISIGYQMDRRGDVPNVSEGVGFKNA